MNAAVFAVDERPQIQAPNRTAPTLPMLPTTPAKATHGYQRNGTIDLFAALDIATGHVITDLRPSHTSVEFIKFLNKINREVPADLDVHVILDNLSTHKTPAVQKWLLLHRRFHFHFTPTYGSWMNLVELWFSALTTKKLQPSNHSEGRVGPVQRDATRLVVARVGRVERCDSVPGVAVLDAAGEPVGAIDSFLRTLEASDATSTTLYSYATALLRWWRFLTANGVDWDRALRTEVRDFVLWLRFTPKLTSGKLRVAGSGYAPATINHNLAVLRSFYDERLDAGDGPLLNPVPSAKTRDGERRHAHHNPMQPFVSQRRAPLRQKTPVTATRGLSEAAFT